eukprot:scaffold44043_cov37-Cyclotella_meneghiniana.AAC.4
MSEGENNFFALERFQILGRSRRLSGYAVDQINYSGRSKSSNRGGKPLQNGKVGSKDRGPSR